MLCAFFAPGPTAAITIAPVRFALVLVLASCGRLGFSDTSSNIPDGGVGPNGTTVRVVVTADYVPAGSGPSTTPGAPVEAATVLVDRGAGTLERRLTDAQGAVTLDADGLVAYHVVHGSSNAWRVYTVATGATGTISLGGIAAPSDGTVSLDLPAGPQSWFEAHLPDGCQSLFDPSSTPSVSVLYDSPCGGQTVRVMGFAWDAPSTARYVDAGLVKLAPGTRTTVTGTYAAMPAHSIQVTNLPAQAETVSAEIFARDQLSMTAMEWSSSPDLNPVTGPTATLTTSAAPGGNTLRVTVRFVRAGQTFSTSTEQIAPISFSAPPISASFDAKGMLPPFTAFDLDPELNFSWASPGSDGTMIVAHVSADNFEWDAYLPPTATALAFPAIPADIGFPRAFTVYTASVARIDVPGATAVGLTPSIDRAFRRWPYDATLFPASGNRIAGAGYVRGFVTE